MASSAFQKKWMYDLRNIDFNYSKYKKLPPKVKQKELHISVLKKSEWYSGLSQLNLVSKTAQHETWDGKGLGYLVTMTVGRKTILALDIIHSEWLKC